MIPNVSKAASVILAWDQSPDPVTGYKIYYGEQSVLTNPSTEVEVGNVLTCIIPDLIPGHTYYFAMKAYNQYGMSGFSNEVTWTVPIAEIVIEDGVDATDWIRTSGTGYANSIYNIDDDVIAFRSTGATILTVYRISLEDTDITDNMVEWEFNYTQNLNSFFVINISTIFGNRNIYYRPIDTNPLGKSTNIHFGIGSAKKTGGWYAILRDLQEDLKTAQPNNNLIGANYFYIYVYGSGTSLMFDNLIFYAE